MKKLLSILIVLFSTAYNAAAQPPPPPPPNTAISLDILVGLLVLIGVFYGIRKLKLKKEAA
ncbi:MAG: hypothetical protein GC178_06435 [Flavobacteriales bacterium]|nr:hypothetical protein [Flavobacteriales bacterium]